MVLMDRESLNALANPSALSRSSLELAEDRNYLITARTSSMNQHVSLKLCHQRQLLSVFIDSYYSIIDARRTFEKLLLLSSGCHDNERKQI